MYMKAMSYHIPSNSLLFHSKVQNFIALMAWTRGHTLGRGSTATVSAAEDCGSGRVFAVKSAELHRSEFLKREQSILSTLNCPQIVTYKGCDVTFESGVSLYNLFMEYAPRGSIADEIGKQRNGGGGGMEEVVVGAYARQILLGLNYLHSNGIVHCDIKGRNVLITDEGVKIADLGCARRVTAAEEEAVIGGTPAFMAPEVARGEEQGFPADVWALGCTVLEMVTGRAPWNGVSDPVSLLYRVGFAGETPEIPNFMSEQGRDFVAKCLKKDPNERWSVGELLKHEFVQQSHSCYTNSPTGVLDRGFWDSVEEFQTTQNPNPYPNPNPSPTQGCSWPRSRIRRLSSSIPNWDWDEKWITVRDNGITESERFSNGQESNFAEVNEKTEDCGLESGGFIEDDNGLVITYEGRRTFISRVRLNNCCNVDDVCCNRKSLLGCSQCIKIVALSRFDSPNKQVFRTIFLISPSLDSFYFGCIVHLGNKISIFS